MITKKRCKTKPLLKERKLLSLSQAESLKEIFQVLANETRLRILHLLAINSSVCVNEIAEHLDMKPQAISNQLQKLTDQKILNATRDGNQIFYKIIDPCILLILDKGICLIEDLKEFENE